MLKGKQITVRPMRSEDIGPFHEKSLDIESRGPWYPLPGTSLAAFEKAFAESGFWTPERGIFVITDKTESGHREHQLAAAERRRFRHRTRVSTAESRGQRERYRQ